MKYSAFLLVSLFVLGGCARLNPPAPVTHYGTKSGRSSDQMVVRDGDTVYSLAKLFNVSMRDLMDMNGLRPPYNLSTGQVIKIPIPSTYTVQQEDTLYGISRAFGVDQTEIARLNNLTMPYRLELDQQLRLPARQGNKNNDFDTASAGTSDEDTYWQSLKQRFGNNGQNNVASNTGSASQDNVSITRPVVRGRNTVEVSDLPPPSSSGTSTASSVPTATSSDAPVSITSNPAASTTTEMARVEPQKTVPSKNLPTGTPVFTWPVQGAVLSEYGPKSGGRHNDGMNIGAPNGTAVRASEAGEVVYAGNELAGFGNLVLVRHAQGWMTAYGHMSKTTISRGSVVKKGQTIGAVGKTGSVNAPQLHFEIRKGSKALNPRKYLP